jgi:hypothetical protein
MVVFVRGVRLSGSHALPVVRLGPKEVDWWPRE